MRSRDVDKGQRAVWFLCSVLETLRILIPLPIRIFTSKLHNTPHKALFALRPRTRNSIPSPLRTGSFQILTGVFKFSEHREVDKRISSWRDLLQSGIHDQRTHVSGGQAEGIPAGVREAEPEGALEVGERHDAWETGQRNDPEVDAAA